MCENCAKGKYTLLRHQTECIVCPSGTYQENLGQHWCQACGKGKYLSDNSTDAGAHDEESDCENCPIGTKILDNGGRHFEYVRVTSGKCSDVDGVHNLKSMEEGLSAMTFLNLPDSDTRKNVEMGWLEIANVSSTDVTDENYWNDVCEQLGNVGLNDTIKITMDQ